MAADLGLYRRQELAAAPALPFVLCGSEESADAADKLIGKGYVAAALPLVPAAWQVADLRLLVGRAGLIIPDGGPDNRTDAERLAARLHAMGVTKLRITTLNGQPEDWKICDWSGSSDEFIAWAKAHTRDYEPPQVLEAPPPDDELEVVRPIRRPNLSVVDGNTALQPKLAEAAAQPLSHDALGEHFIEKHGEDWRYVHPWGQWFQWDGDRWKQDTTEHHVGLAKHVTRDALIWPEAQLLTPSSKREINSIGTAKALLSIARNMCPATTDQWDQDPWLMGVPGGVLDLQTGRMLEAQRDQYITKQCAVAPASGKPERWLEFLRRVTDDDDNLIAFLHRCAGYWITGSAREHSLTFLYGTGANGKSVFIRTMGGILGEESLQYAANCQMAVFTEAKVERHSTELARLRGARLVMAEETASGAKWDQAKIQWLTGEGSVTARFMRQDDFTFKPSFKLLLAGNHKPQLRSIDEAIKRRFHLVPFTVTIPVEERDQQLYDRLRDEWPQIMGWMLDGCLEWQQHGLKPPQVITDATNTYLETEDAIGQWIEECCDQTGSTDSASLFESYRKWCDRNGEHELSRRAWANTMVERNFLPRKGAGGMRRFDGISIKIVAHGGAVNPYQ